MVEMKISEPMHGDSISVVTDRPGFYHNSTEQGFCRSMTRGRISFDSILSPFKLVGAMPRILMAGGGMTVNGVNPVLRFGNQNELPRLIKLPTTEEDSITMA